MRVSLMLEKQEISEDQKNLQTDIKWYLDCDFLLENHLWN
jgi:hypothetical protein